MLVLTRNLGERLFIDGKLITISVEAIKGNQIRIGIEAPKEISIHREEVYERIQAPNKCKQNMICSRFHGHYFH